MNRFATLSAVRQTLFTTAPWTRFRHHPTQLYRFALSALQHIKQIYQNVPHSSSSGSSKVQTKPPFPALSPNPLQPLWGISSKINSNFRRRLINYRAIKRVFNEVSLKMTSLSFQPNSWDIQAMRERELLTQRDQAAGTACNSRTFTHWLLAQAPSHPRAQHPNSISLHYLCPWLQMALQGPLSKH